MKPGTGAEEQAGETESGTLMSGRMRDLNGHREVQEGWDAQAPGS